MESQPTHYNKGHSFPHETPQDESQLLSETTTQIVQAWWAELDPARRAAHLQRLERQVKSRCLWLPSDVWE